MSSSSSSSSLRRITSISSNDVNTYDDDNNDNSLLLSAQNNSLQLELIKYKRSIQLARKQLSLLRKRSSSMEHVVSILQRLWSQLEIDTSMLLDELGDICTDNNTSAITSSLLKFQKSGNSYKDVDPTNINDIPTLWIDKWSSSDFVIEESKAAKDKFVSTYIEMSSVERMARLNEKFTTHGAFMQTLIERLCMAINITGMYEQVPDILEALSLAKELNAERFALTDKMNKLSNEIVELNTKREQSELRKQVIEKLLQSNGQEDEGQASSASQKDIESDAGQLKALTIYDVNAVDQQEVLEKELRRKIQILEKQVADSEEAKAKAEMTLTEQTSRPQTETEAQMSYIRKAMDNVRQAHRIRSVKISNETIATEKKLVNLQLAKSKLEASVKARIDEAELMADIAVKKVSSELEAVEKVRDSSKNDIAKINQLKDQATQSQTNELLARKEFQTLQTQNKEKMGEEEKLMEQLMELNLKETSLELDIYNAYGTKFPNSNFFDNDTNEQLKLLKDKTLQLHNDIKDQYNSINDMMMEIEGVTADNVNIKENITKLLLQLSETQTTRRGILEENLTSSNVINNIKEKQKKLQTKHEVISGLLKHQETLISKIRSSEYNSKIDYQTEKKNKLEEEDKYMKEDVVSDKKLQAKENNLLSTQKQNKELQGQCDELSKKLEKNRKRRLELQREDKVKPAVKKEKVDEVATNDSNSEDIKMLETTLGMLRCSVCKDRFKSVAITRCFHLFCKECIDENLRNRSRKCPACHTKFGQDDVSSYG